MPPAAFGGDADRMFHGVRFAEKAADGGAVFEGGGNPRRKRPELLGGKSPDFAGDAGAIDSAQADKARLRRLRIGNTKRR